jgi:prophage regulatory protein
MHQRIQRLPEVINNVQLSRSSIYLKVKNGTFPAPVKISDRAIGWHSNEINAWIASRTSDSVSGV